MIEDILTLKDGRKLGYGLYGNTQGLPLLDFHGIPGSRREAALMADFLGREDLCFVGFDRPGYGCSTPRGGFRILDLPEDVIALTNHLKLDRFLVLGYSGGGPFALALAARHPERIAAIGIVSGVGPARSGSKGMHASNQRKFDMARKMPWLARAMLFAAFSGLRKNPARLSSQLHHIWEQMPAPDQKVLSDWRFADGILAVTRDAIQNSVNGWVNEELLMALPWGFTPQEISCSNIYLWHGSKDKNVPLAMGKAVAEQLPGCRASFLKDEGHLSLLYNHGSEIIATLVQAGS